MNDVDGCEIIEPTMATTNGNFHRSKNKNQRKVPLLISQAERKKKKLKRTSAKMSNKKAKLDRNSFDDSLADEQMETAEDVSILEEESLIVDTTAISAVLHGKERFALFPCTLMSDAHIVLFPSKSKLQIFGSFEVQALFGDVSIDGYLCKAGQADDTRWIPVVAPWKTSPPVVIKCPLSHAKAPKLSRLQWRLKQVTDQVDEVLTAYGSGFSVVLLRSYSPPACSLIKEMYGVVFYKPLPGKTPNYLHLNKTCCVPRGALRDKYDGELRDAIDDVFSAIAAKKDSLLHSVTAILGAKGAGKSTLVRLLSNLLIREDSPPVYLLDTDVGQSETTPPGCLSLIKLDKPLLGLAANNQQATFAETYFFGDVTPATLRQRYLSAVRRLVDSFRKNAPPGSPLIVNTHGWLSGLGIQLMHEILAIAEPNFIFHLRTRGPEVDEFDREIIPSSCEMLWEAEKPSPP
uniref:Polyribonucleotide 5'-hydroxyl-kinase Clp1 P-loop domain-containing protein n=1 Tax=Plectus sambesii TaxID=2011161 RepID=A0A914WYK5_9BILA